MRTRSLAVIASLALAGLVAAGPVRTAVAMPDRMTSSATSFPGSNGRIAYVKSWNEGGPGSDIFTVRPNGTGNKRLTFGVRRFEPDWRAIN